MNKCLIPRGGLPNTVEDIVVDLIADYTIQMKEELALRLCSEGDYSTAASIFIDLLLNTANPKRFNFLYEMAILADKAGMVKRGELTYPDFVSDIEMRVANSHDEYFEVESILLLLRKVFEARRNVEVYSRGHLSLCGRIYFNVNGG